MKAPSIAERLANINDYLLIMEALAEAPAANESIQERDQAAAIIARTANDARTEMFWLLDALPDAIAITPAPTQDQREAAER